MTSSAKSMTSIADVDWLQVRKLLPHLRRHGARTTGVVLDLGCGASPWRPLFPHAQAYLRMDRYAVDPEVTVIEDPRRLPLADGAVDAVLASRMLGDIPDQLGLFTELARVLRPGGRILIYESISYPQHDLPHDYWRVLPQGLAWVADRAGLTLAELHYCGGAFTQIAVPINTLMIGDLGGGPLLRLVAKTLRAVVNLVCAGLDKVAPRPHLAADYFAVVARAAPALAGA